jgi:hypothetical protein
VVFTVVVPTVVAVVAPGSVCNPARTSRTAIVTASRNAAGAP